MSQAGNLAATRRYRKNHPERERARHLRRTREERHAEYLRLRDATIERARVWRTEHPGATTLQGRRWRAANPDRARILSLLKEGRRRARKKTVLSVCFTADDLLTIRKQQNNLCAYCGSVLAEVHFDHMTPLSRGGAHAIWNMCAACPVCNRRKSVQTADEFRRTLSQ